MPKYFGGPNRLLPCKPTDRQTDIQSDGQVKLSVCGGAIDQFMQIASHIDRPERDGRASATDRQIDTDREKEERWYCRVSE